MAARIFERFVGVKALIRVALAVLSLHGAAYAQVASRTTPQPSGNNYNFMAGGGG